ncbi:MAG TPA: hypothetical protein DIC42_00085 [Holosporales bacterium]|nr:hypothetical protein [Holosporales bacterium]
MVGTVHDKLLSFGLALEGTTVGQACTKVGEAAERSFEGAASAGRRAYDTMTGKGSAQFGTARSVRVDHLEWGKGIQKQGMPFEDFVGTRLPQGSRLPANFKTFDYYDRATKRAISVKTMNTNTTAKLENPQQIYSTLKGNML